MTPVIPPELWVEAIDHLHDDKSTLCKCSLVSRFWLWSSRSHLFSTIVLKSPNIETTLAVLCASGSTIPPHVRAIEIDDHHGMSMGPTWDSPWLSKALPKFPQLSAVKKLSISYMKWDALTPEAKECLYTISHGLKTLTLESTIFKTLGQAVELISSAPSLECLSLGSTNCQSEDNPLTKFSVPPMKHIIFRGNGIPPVIFYWLCHWQPTPSVHTLKFGGISVVEIPSISAYIWRLGPALEHLELACFSDLHGEIHAALHKEFDLTHSTSLKTILIDNLVLYTHSPGSHTYDWIIDILSRITSRFISRVTMVVSLHTPQELVPLNLPALAALFAHGNPTFSELSTRLQFRIHGRVNRTEARAAITESLRELDSQGRLEFGRGRIGSGKLCQMRIKQSRPSWKF